MKRNVILTLTIILMAGQISAFEFCQNGTMGEGNIRLISLNDMLKENPIEWEWQPSQKIEIEARVENKNDEDATYILEAIFKDGDKTIKTAKDSDDLKQEFSLSANERKSVSLEFETNEDIETGKHNLYLKFYKKNNENEECTENSEVEIIMEKIEMCKNGKLDEDKLEITRIQDETDTNQDKWIWAPGNNIKISLDIENRDYSQRNFAVELVFLDKNNKEVFLADNSDDIIKEISLDKEENYNMNFYFKLRPDIGEEYTLYARAYDKNNEDICTSLKAKDKSNPITIKIEKSERKVIIAKVEGPKNTETSSQEQYVATIANLGDKDESKTLAIIYNYRLGIKEIIEIPNLKSGEEKEIIFNISIPKNASIARYSLLFSTEYEYKEEQNYFRSSSEEVDDISYPITVSQKGTQEIQEKIQNKRITKESQEDKMINPTTIITGNTIGIPNKSPSWIILTILIILAIIGIILLFKKPKIKRETKIEPPQVIRRYKARLS